MLQKIPELLSLIEHQKYKRFLGVSCFSEAVACNQAVLGKSLTPENL
jgi:hypothetical protein